MAGHLHLGLSATLIFIQDIQAIGAKEAQHRANGSISWVPLAPGTMGKDFLKMEGLLSTGKTARNMDIFSVKMSQITLAGK